jgi:phosphate/sulfate permease
MYDHEGRRGGGGHLLMSIFAPENSWIVAVASFAMPLVAVLLVVNPFLGVVVAVLTVFYCTSKYIEARDLKRRELTYRENTWGF